MQTRKIQKSGTTYYLYLPASWCREHNITTDSVVHLEKSSKGNLVVQPKKTEKSLSALNIELEEYSTEVINKMIIASYINPVKEFKITLQKPLDPDQILQHKRILGGLELVDFEDKNISCQTSLALNDPDTLLLAMIRKILSITKLMKKDKSHELLRRYEEEIDKSNLLIHKSIISSLMYRRESKLRHIDLFYIGDISRMLERITDLLITLTDNKLIEILDNMMNMLLEILEHFNKDKVIEFIKELEKLGDVKVKDLDSYKKKRVYSSLGHIAEILCDWVITEIVDED